MARYLIYNGPQQTTAAPTKVALAASTIKTLLQIQPGATNSIKIVEWGISFDASAAATPVQVELIETNVAATVTATAAADITKYDADALNGGNPTTSLFQVGTANTGYTATAEGTITTVRNLDGPQLVAPTNQYIKQFPLGERPIIQAGQYGRIRVTAPAAVNAYCYMILEV